MFVLCLPRKTNSQVKLKLFVVTKPTLHRTIWFDWKVVLLAMLFTDVVLPCLKTAFIVISCKC